MSSYSEFVLSLSSKFDSLKELQDYRPKKDGKLTVFHIYIASNGKERTFYKVYDSIAEGIKDCIEKDLKWKEFCFDSLSKVFVFEDRSQEKKFIEKSKIRKEK